MLNRISRSVRGTAAEHMWDAFQRQVRESMDERVMRGFEAVLIEFQRKDTVQRNELTLAANQVRAIVMQNREAVASLGDALRTLLRAYEGAVARDDIVYLEDAAWEADSALAQHTGTSVLGVADVDAESADGRSDVASPEEPDGSA